MTPPFDDPPNAPPIARPVARPIGPPPGNVLGTAARGVGWPPAMTRGQAAIDILAIMALNFALQFAIFAAGVPQLLSRLFPTLGPLWVNVCLGVLALIAVSMVLYLRRQSVAAVGLVRASPWRTMGAAFLAIWACYGAVLVAVPLFLWLTGRSLEGLVEERAKFFDEVPHLPVWQAALFSAFVGLHEEVLFRGFILGRLKALLRSNVGAVLISGLIFGLLHFYQGPIGVVQTTSVGIVLAMVVIRCGSVWPAILAHASFDTIGLALIPWLERTLPEVLKQAASGPASQP
jgi:CAAX protease family protein